MVVKKYKNESVLFAVSSDTDVSDRFTHMTCVVKQNKDDLDIDAIFLEEKVITDPTNLFEYFFIPSSTTKTLSGKYFYEIWIHNSDKSDMEIVDNGVLFFIDSIYKVE